MKRLAVWLLLGAMFLPLAADAALTVVVDDKQAWGGLAVNFLTITWDDSYPTGGEAITAAQCGVSAVNEIAVFVDNAAYVVQFDKSALKLMAFSAPAADYTVAGTDSLLAFDEADNATDLSSVVTRAIVFGKP